MKKEILEQVNESTSEVKEVQLKDVINGLETLQIIINQKLPVFSSFKLSLFLKAVSPMVEAFNVEKDKLIKDFGTPTLSEDGKETGHYTFPDADKAKEFNDKMNELLEVVIDVKIPELKVADLGNIEIEPIKLTTLTWLLQE